MKVIVLEEAGHELALRGMAYSYKDRSIDPEEWWPGQKVKAYRRAAILAHRDGGHNKYLESIKSSSYLYSNFSKDLNFQMDGIHILR